MRKSSRKYYRTTLLGIAAMAVLIWSAITQFGLDKETMLQLFLVTLVVIALVIVAAAITVGLWIGLRKLLSK